MTYEIPVIDMQVGELFDFASSFADKVVSHIDFERINTIQDFVEQFTQAGILPPGLSVVYDAATNALSLPVNFDFNFNDLNLRNLANLEEIDYQQLLDFGDHRSATDTFEQGRPSSTPCWGCCATPLDQLARWELLDIWTPSSRARPCPLRIWKPYELDRARGPCRGRDDLPGRSAGLGRWCNVGLQDLFNFDQLDSDDFAWGVLIGHPGPCRIQPAEHRRSYDDRDYASTVWIIRPLCWSATWRRLGVTLYAGALDSLGTTSISLQRSARRGDMVDVNLEDLAAAPTDRRGHSGRGAGGRRRPFGPDRSDRYRWLFAFRQDRYGLRSPQASSTP